MLCHAVPCCAAGVGKTAIVEGLAQRIIAGDVPPGLLGSQLLELDLAALAAGCMMPGEFEVCVYTGRAPGGAKGSAAISGPWVVWALSRMCTIQSVVRVLVLSGGLGWVCCCWLEGWGGVVGGAWALRCMGSQVLELEHWQLAA
jgi:hypothetical protein